MVPRLEISACRRARNLRRLGQSSAKYWVGLGEVNEGA